MPEQLKFAKTKLEEHSLELLYRMPPVSYRKDLEEEQSWESFLNIFLEDVISFLNEHSEGVTILASLCDNTLPECPESEDYLHLHKAIENEQEMEFINVERTLQVERFRILSAIDTIASVSALGKFILNPQNKAAIEVFLNTKLLMKSMAFLTHYHRIAERNQFVAIKDEEKKRAVDEVQAQNSEISKERSKKGGKNKYSAEFKLIMQAFFETHPEAEFKDFEKYFKRYTGCSPYIAEKYEFSRSQKTGKFYRKKIGEPDSEKKEIKENMLKRFFGAIQKK